MQLGWRVQLIIDRSVDPKPASDAVAVSVGGQNFVGKYFTQEDGQRSVSWRYPQDFPFPHFTEQNQFTTVVWHPAGIQVSHCRESTVGLTPKGIQVFAIKIAWTVM